MRLAGLAALLVLLAAAPAAAQTALPGQPVDAIGQVRARALQPVPRLPAPAQLPERWVPERRIFLPEVGREVVVPPHQERRISDQQVSVPTLQAYPANGRGPVLTIPAGDRLPAALRQGP